MNEILINWNVTNTRGGTSVLYTEAGTGVVATQRAQIAFFFSDTARLFANTTTATVATQGRVIEDTTGQLIGDWSDSSPVTMQGTGTNPPVQNSSQALMRLNTGLISEGRRIKGRWFLPGFSAATSEGGELNGDAQDELASAAGGMVANGGLLVWSRPRPAGSGQNGDLPARVGTSADVTSMTAWNEFAVLRNRR